MSDRYSIHMAVILLLLMLFSDAATGRTLTLMSWNIEHLAADDNQGCRPRKQPEYEAIKTYINQSGADLIAFQEVEDLRAARRVFDPARYAVHISQRPERKFDKCYDSPGNRLMQRTGFAVRKDLEFHLGLRLSRQPDLAWLSATPADRWGVYLRLERADEPGRAPLHLLSIHLKSGCAYQNMTGRQIRRICSILGQQVAALSAWIRARAERNENFIIAGDFNRQLDQLSDTVWERLETGAPGAGYVDLEKALHGIKHPQPFNRKFPYAVDHIIYNQAMDRQAREDRTYFDTNAAAYSDHLPLFAVFDF